MYKPNFFSPNSLSLSVNKLRWLIIPLKKSPKSTENYLIMKDSTVHKKYMGQIYVILDFIKTILFYK